MGVKKYEFCVDELASWREGNTVLFYSVYTC